MTGGRAFPLVVPRVPGALRYLRCAVSVLRQDGWRIGRIALDRSAILVEFILSDRVTDLVTYRVTRYPAVTERAWRNR